MLLVLKSVRARRGPALREEAVPCPQASQGAGLPGLPSLYSGRAVRAQRPRPALYPWRTKGCGRRHPALSPQQPQTAGPSGEELAADSVRAVSVRTLYLVSTTVDRMSDVSVRARPPPCD